MVWAWSFMFIIPATLETEIGGQQFKTSLEKVSSRPHLKNKLKVKRRPDTVVYICNPTYLEGQPGIKN
jgi:uncharacterized protein (DUF302 family)